MTAVCSRRLVCLGVDYFCLRIGSNALSQSILLSASSCVIVPSKLRVSAVAKIVASRPPMPLWEYFARRSIALVVRS